MKKSMHVYRGIGSSTYGLTCCDGVCWSMKRAKKSSVMVKGRNEYMNSYAVVLFMSVAMSAREMEKPMRYITRRPTMRYAMNFATLPCVSIGERFSDSFWWLRRIG